MPTEELLKFKVDISEVESKLARIKALQEEVTKVRAAGGDTSPLDAELNKEIVSFGKLGQVGRQSAGGVNELVKSHRDIAGVAELAGAKLGPMVGNFADLFQVVASGNPALIAITAGLAVATLGWKAFAASVEESTKKLEENATAAEKANRAARDQKGDQFDRLNALGAGTPENQAAAEANARNLRKRYGITGAHAAEAVAVGTAAGIGDTSDLAALAMFMEQGGQLGADAEAPANARKFLQASGTPTVGGGGVRPFIIPPAKNAYLAAAEARASAIPGMRTRIAASREHGAAAFTPEGLALEGLSEEQRKEFGVNSEAGIRSKLSRLAELEKVFGEGSVERSAPSYVGGEKEVRRLRAKNPLHAEYLKLRELSQEVGVARGIVDGGGPRGAAGETPPGRSVQGAQAAAATVIINKYIENVGTKIGVGGDRNRAVPTTAPLRSVVRSSEGFAMLPVRH